MRGRYTIWSALAFVIAVATCAAFVTALLLFTFFPRMAFAHDVEVMACFSHGQEVKKIKSYAHPSGLWGELYVSKGGPVVLALSPITGYEYNWNKKGEDDLTIQHSEHPIAFFVDAEGDGRFNKSYVDKGGQGKCDEIELYETFDKREGENDPNNPQKEASEIWSLG